MGNIGNIALQMVVNRQTVVENSKATSPTGIRRSQDHRRGFSNITTAVSMNIAAEAPTNVAPGAKNGKLNGKLRTPPKKKAISMLLESLTLSKVFPNT